MTVKRDDEGRVTVLFVTGGAFQASVPAAMADVCAVVDSQDELLKVPDLPNVIKIPLGDHETVLTLLDRARGFDPDAAALLDEYRGLPNVYLSAGMAQDPRLGACAIRDLAQSGQLEQYFADILVRVLECANGQLSVVVIREVNSQAGGMGSAGGPEIGARFRAFVAARTHAQIAQHMLRMGGLTYMPIAKRAAANTGQTTKRNLDALFASGDPRVIRDLEFVELPLRSAAGLPLRDKRGLRDALAGPLLVARCSTAVVRELDAREVNHKPESTYGEVRTIRARWSDGLDQDELMRAAATAYRGRLAELRHECGAPDRSVVHGVRVDLAPVGAAPTVDQVTAAIRRGDVRGPLFDRLSDPGLPEFEATVYVEITADQAVAVDEILRGLAAADTLEQVRTRVRRVRGVLAHLEDAQQAAESAQRVAEAAVDKRRASMTQEMRRLRSPMRTVAAVLSPKTSVRRATSTFGSAIEALQRAGEARARAVALDAVVARFRAECAAYEEACIGEMDRALAAFVGDRPLHSQAITVAPLAEVYAALAAAAARTAGAATPSASSLGALLLQAVRHVTLPGLAEMLGTTAVAEEIVAALENDRYAWKAPMWGGGSRTGAVEPRERFVVLPPVSDGDLQVLRSAAARRGFAPMLVGADTVAAGCRIVALDFYPVADRADVETAIYSQAQPPLPAAQLVM